MRNSVAHRREIQVGLAILILVAAAGVLFMACCSSLSVAKTSRAADFADKAGNAPTSSPTNPTGTSISSGPRPE